MTASPSRRRLLQLGASLPFAWSTRADAQTGAAFDFDVVVIGAGAAGIAAGRELARLGKSFVILEARNRVGGRVFTDTSLGEGFDAGAIYIHWAEKNPWRKLAQELGVSLLDSDQLPGSFRLYQDGETIPRGSRRSYATVGERFDPDIAPVPDIPMTTRVEADGDDALRAVSNLARMALGEEAERVSALDYARLWSGDDYVAPDGYGSLVTRAAEGLPVRLSTLVRAVDWTGQGVTIDTDRGALRARAVIVTVPVGVLRSERIRFTPRLPDDTLRGLDGLQMGALTKIALRFNGERFGIAPGTDLWDIAGPRATFDFECWPFNRNLIVAVFGGDHAREIVRMGETAAVDLALSRLARIVGEGARRAFVGGRLAGWSEDPFAQGSYSHALPGHADARALLAAPVGGRIFFAGEATGGENFGGAMTAGGAYLAGEAAARLAGVS
jgi:monoamine oxidase